ncbi:MAG: aspartate kinase [Anaerotignum sp.]
MIVAKFGGSSLANATQFQKVKNIVLADSRRAFIVPSAPGKRFGKDDKVTDLLYRCYHERCEGQSFHETFEKIRQRYLDIVLELNLSVDIEMYLDEVYKKIASGQSLAYCASRGEYLNGILLANFLNFIFLDAAEVIVFDKTGVFDENKTYAALHKRLEETQNVVIPGFYGSKEDGSICIFSRGGSDITGAIVARAIEAELYENWTDVFGFYMADPRIVEEPRLIRHITYCEMYELCSAGAAVFHEDAIYPVNYAGIPTNIRNTDFPEHLGTLVTANAIERDNFAIFAGIAGKRGFSLLVLEKEGSDGLVPFLEGVLQVSDACGILFQYLPLGTNCVCMMVDTKKFSETESLFAREMEKLKLGYSFTSKSEVASIVLVGYGIVHNRMMINRIYEALKKADIDVVMINQGSGEISTWVGVAEADLDKAICVLYEAFVEYDLK